MFVPLTEVSLLPSFPFTFIQIQEIFLLYLQCTLCVYTHTHITHTIFFKLKYFKICQCYQICFYALITIIGQFKKFCYVYSTFITLLICDTHIVLLFFWACFFMITLIRILTFCREREGAHSAVTDTQSSKANELLLLF